MMDSSPVVSPAYWGWVRLILLSLTIPDEAFRWLDKGFEVRVGAMTWIPQWAVYGPPRSDPRFQALLKKMNFPATQG